LIPRRLLDAAPSDADVAVRAPGRANIIGEHTDYNEGFVLPMALDCATYIAGRRRTDVVRLVSLQEPGEVTVDLRTGAGPTSGWGAYVSAVVRALLDASIPVDGLDAVVHSEVPVGAGLSSSAALEVGLALALSAQPLDSVRVAQICRRAEQSYVGVDVGIMDQLVCAAARARHALLIDCRDNSIEHVPVPEDVRSWRSTPEFAAPWAQAHITSAGRSVAPRRPCSASRRCAMPVRTTSLMDASTRSSGAGHATWSPRTNAY
jgi:galactokinase